MHSKVASPTSMFRCCCNLTSRFLLPTGHASPVALIISPATPRYCPSCLREGEQRPKFPPSDVVEKWPLSLAKTGLHPQKGVGSMQPSCAGRALLWLKMMAARAGLSEPGIGDRVEAG